MTQPIPTPWEGGPQPLGEPFHIDSASGGYAPYTSVSDAIYELVRRADDTDKAQAKTHALAVAAAGSADTLHDTTREIGEALLEVYQETCVALDRAWRATLAALIVAGVSLAGTVGLALVVILR